MYVRTVWVDGFRHAVLTRDDPYYLKLHAKRKRPLSSVCTNKIPKRNSRLSDHTEDLEGCLKKLNLVIRSDKFITKHRPKVPKEFEIEKLDLADVDNDSENGLLIRATPQQLNEYESSRPNVNSFNMRNLRVNRTSRLEVKENTELSERVLQWLDLAGKVDLLAPENAERMTQPRHSWPEIQRRNHMLSKSKTAVDVRPKESCKMYSPKSGDSSKTQQSGTIDRHDFYVPTSTNTIENYARQSRNAKNTPRVESTGKNALSKKSKDLRANVAETRQRVVTERNAVEKQYADLVSKKLIPDLGAGSKKQVHIFMPEMPKKLNSNSTSRTESLLSHLSHLSQKSSLK